MKLPRALRFGLCLGFTAAGLMEAAADPAVTPTQDPVLAAVFPAIVRIEAIRLRPNDGRLTKQWSAGSGVVISPTGHVLTNCHVTDDGDYFRCYLFDGSHVDAKCIGQDALTDLAVLQLDLTQRPAGAPPLVVAPFGDSAALHAGDTVYALGSPGFLAQSVTRGIVSNPSLVLPEQTAGPMVLRGENVGTLVRWILHDARIFGGNSGGPLVNTRGEIVGINELGVFNLSGAIPGNLARAVAGQLVEHGRVIRGWSGITVQPRLEADGAPRGVVIADLAQASPAAAADLRPGDVILAGDGEAIDDAEEKAVAHFNRLETAKAPGSVFTLDLLRSGQKRTVQVTLAPREPAETDPVELRGWGAVVRDLTRALVRTEQLPDATGVWVDNVQPAGPAGQAEPVLRRGDVLVAVDGAPVRDVAGLRSITAAKIGSAPAKPHPVLATFRRDGALLQAVVELRELRDHNVTQQARKAWLGVESQPLTQKLRTRLGIAAGGGARLTRIYADTAAARAGLQVGDVITAIDGMAVEARRAEDSDVLARQVRQYRAGTAATFTLWRAGATIDLPVTLEMQPTPPAELPWWEDPDLEFSAHDVAFDDRVRLQLPAGLRGVLVESAVPAGWAALAGLRGDDVILEAGGVPVAAVAELEAARRKAAKEPAGWWVLLVHRRGQTLLVEISLKPAKTKS
jgi:serine protease Do